MFCVTFTFIFWLSTYPFITGPILSPPSSLNKRHFASLKLKSTFASFSFPALSSAIPTATHIYCVKLFTNWVPFLSPQTCPRLFYSGNKLMKSTILSSFQISFKIQILYLSEVSQILLQSLCTQTTAFPAGSSLPNLMVSSCHLPPSALSKWAPPPSWVISSFSVYEILIYGFCSSLSGRRCNVVHWLTFFSLLNIFILHIQSPASLYDFSFEMLTAMVPFWWN